MSFVCPVCEETEYEERDGFYFCTTCFTQSQEMQVQVVDMEYYTSIDIDVTSIMKKSKKKKNSEYLGRPWTIYEGFQCIILAQCDALISLGARADLKEVVYTFWANYLSKLRVAFCEKEKYVPDIVFKAGRGRQREILRGTMENPRPIPRKLANDETEISESSQDLKDLIFMDEVSRSSKSYETASLSARWMNLSKTAAFCALGLRITNPDILLQQFVRWLHEGQVPYMSTTHLLTQDMVLFGLDLQLFRAPVMTLTHLVGDMNQLTALLKTKKIPTPSVQSMINLLVDKFHLPDELKVISGRLFEEKPQSRSKYKTHYLRVDFFAAQYIVFALKLIFGLDDSTEQLLSVYSQDMQSILDPGVNVFVWSEWRSYQMEKASKQFDALTLSKSKNNFNCSPHHLEEMLKYHSNMHRDERTRTTHLRNSTALEDITDGLGTQVDMAVAAGTHNTTESKRTLKVDDTSTLQKKFSTSTLKHIVDFDVFEASCQEKINHPSWEKLKGQRERICSNIVYSDYDRDDEESMYETRSTSYLWLLKFVANVVGCTVVKLDEKVTNLQNTLKFGCKLSDMYSQQMDELDDV